MNCCLAARTRTSLQICLDKTSIGGWKTVTEFTSKFEDLATLTKRGLVLTLSFILLAGCGGTQPTGEGALHAIPQAARAAHADRAKPWMLPGAKSEDLLYIATGDNVYVLSYPGGKLTGSLNVAGYELCADEKGDVFVPQTADSTIFVYAHGGDSPIRTLSDGDQPLGCAVDPITGNLAVTNEGSGAGEVAIYRHARGTAQWYQDEAIGQYGLCGYDDQGNLFLDGTGTSNVFAELPRGSDTFKNFTLGARFVAYGSVQWDGTFITLSNPSAHAIYRLKILKTTFKVTGTTHLHQWRNGYSGNWPYIETWLQNGTFLAQSSSAADVGLWPYPAGGNPSKVIGGFKSGSATVYGVTISLAR